MTRQARFGAGLAAVVALATASLAGQTLTRQDSASMQRKIDAIAARGQQPGGPALRTSFTDREVNAYLKYDGQSRIPTGVVNPQITIAENGRLDATALVDVDAVRKAQPSAMLDLVAMFAGSVEVRASGMLRAANGKGSFVLDRATVGGVPVPKSLLQTLVTQYSRNPDLPDGFDLDKPFDLPAAIRSIEMQPGAATIIQ